MIQKIVKSTAVTALLMTLATNAHAVETEIGTINGGVKALHILSGDDNGYDPNSGSAFLLSLKYKSPTWNNLHMGVGFYYTNELLGLTDEDSERVARGLFVNDERSSKAFLGELYLKYTGSHYALYGGNMIFNSPLTTNAVSTMPNFHRVYGVEATPMENLKLSLSQITHISFGARSMADFGLIGEGTGTAGTTIKPSTVEQAKFNKVSEATLGANAADTNGLTVANIDYKLAGVNLSLWDYYADDIANTLYLEANKAFKVAGNKLKLNAQFLTQSNQGDNLAGDIDFQLFGLKAAYGNKKWGVLAALNKSFGDNAMFNAWMGDPAYTSSIFSRNAYRKNVTAFKVGARYNLLSNLTLKASYANYGQSETSAPLKVLKVANEGRTMPLTDATEMDLAVIYKPKKNMMIKVFYADRTSEYHGVNGSDLTQSHIRAIVSYKF